VVEGLEAFDEVLAGLLVGGEGTKKRSDLVAEKKKKSNVKEGVNEGGDERNPGAPARKLTQFALAKTCLSQSWSYSRSPRRKQPQEERVDRGKGSSSSPASPGGGAEQLAAT